MLINNFCHQNIFLFFQGYATSPSLPRLWRAKGRLTRQWPQKILPGHLHYNFSPSSCCSDSPSCFSTFQKPASRCWNFTVKKVNSVPWTKVNTLWDCFWQLRKSGNAEQTECKPSLPLRKYLLNLPWNRVALAQGFWKNLKCVSSNLIYELQTKMYSKFCN